jgi:hypothetical protein
MTDWKFWTGDVDWLPSIDHGWLIEWPQEWISTKYLIARLAMSFWTLSVSGSGVAGPM